MRFTEQELTRAFKRMEALKSQYPNIEEIVDNFLNEIEGSDDEEEGINEIEEILNQYKRSPKIAEIIISKNFNLTINN
jgi:uncharacterized protein (UPF0305 family)